MSEKLPALARLSRVEVLAIAGQRYDEIVLDIQRQFPMIERNLSHRKHFQNGAWYGYQLCHGDLKKAET